MTTTTTPQQVPENTQPTATQPAPFTRRHRKALIATAAAAALLAAFGTIGALAGTAHPANAAAMITKDGYTLAYSLTQAQITSDFGSAAPYITSAAIGTDVQGNAEADVYLTPQGITLMNAAASLKSETVSQYFESDIPGSAVTVTGDVLRIDAPESVVAGLGGLGSPSASPSATQPARAAPAAAPTATVTAQAPAAPAAPAAGNGLAYAGQGPDGGVYVNSVTSAPFGVAVADSYAGGGGPDFEEVYSPVTGQTYGMTYENVGNDTIEATGGNGALAQFSYNG